MMIPRGYSKPEGMHSALLFSKPSESVLGGLVYSHTAGAKECTSRWRTGCHVVCLGVLQSNLPLNHSAF